MTNQSGLKRVVIAGGGTAGWIAALYLNRILQRGACEVVLVESASIGTIGVGEATIPTLVHLIRMLGLDEAELMRRCSATYKLGIKFEGWGGEGHVYWHPFGGMTGAAGRDLYQFWLKRKLRGADAGAFSDYTLQAKLADANRGPTADIMQGGGYAYHIDATALADYLKELATAEGVRHYFGTIEDVSTNEDGEIVSAGIGAGRCLEAGLFIDATGFSSLLIEQTLHDPWIDWSHYLLCDRAVAMPLPSDDVKAPYTRSRAAQAGWMWRIPLHSRTGSGYVYSSAHTGDTGAADALIEASGLARRRTADPRFLKMRVGRRTEFWKGNCVSVGLSSGFIEPLESTGIHLIQKAVLTLANLLPAGRIDPALRKAFNLSMARAYEEIRDFVLLHYIVAKRSEPFWQDAQHVNRPDRLAHLLDVYRVCGIIDYGQFELFMELSHLYILTGNGVTPERPIVPIDVLNEGAVAEALRDRRTWLGQGLAAAPGHDSLLAQIHARPI